MVVPPANRRFAKSMRQEMTKPEFRLWLRLRKPGLQGLRFRKQSPIGPWIVDFFCPERKLIVEVDVDQHGFPDGEERVAQRDAWLRGQRYRVLRFWNHDVLTNLEGVCEAIIATAKGD